MGNNCLTKLLNVSTKGSTENAFRYFTPCLPRLLFINCRDMIEVEFSCFLRVKLCDTLCEVRTRDFTGRKFEFDWQVEEKIYFFDKKRTTFQI